MLERRTCRRSCDHARGAGVNPPATQFNLPTYTNNSVCHVHIQFKVRRRINQDNSLQWIELYMAGIGSDPSASCATCAQVSSAASPSAQLRSGTSELRSCADGEAAEET